jgi:hypothetical protein
MGAADMALAWQTAAPVLVCELFQRRLVSDLTVGAEK